MIKKRKNNPAFKQHIVQVKEGICNNQYKKMGIFLIDFQDIKPTGAFLTPDGSKKLTC